MCLQGLNISGETSQSEENVVLDAEDFLEIECDGLELCAETSISCDCDALLSLHGDH